MNKKRSAIALVGAAAVVLAGCSGGTDETSSSTATSADSSSAADGQDITLWLMGGDTPDELRQYLIATYNENTGGTLTIEEQAWGDAVSKLTTALPDPENTPDVTEIGNTQASTFTSIGAFTDLTDMYEELGGDSLLQSFVEAGTSEGTIYAYPYYYGSRYMFYRKDIWDAAGKEVPTTLSEFNETVAELRTDDMSGFYIGGSDWRNGISWIFANGGELATEEDGTWTSTLSMDETIEGLTQFQALFQDASNAPVTESDSTPWVNINNNETTGVPEAATIMAPGWAHWSIGDLNDDGETYTWNDDTFGVFVLPGVDGGAAPVFAGGSNIAVSAASQNQEGAKELLKIIFSAEYQEMLGGAGLGPANLDYASSLGDDEFATALTESASNSKLTPAAPGWAAVEASGLLEEFFGKVADGGDIPTLAAEYDAKINELING